MKFNITYAYRHTHICRCSRRFCVDVYWTILVSLLNQPFYLENMRIIIYFEKLVTVRMHRYKALIGMTHVRRCHKSVFVMFNFCRSFVYCPSAFCKFQVCAIKKLIRMLTVAFSPLVQKDNCRHCAVEC